MQASTQFCTTHGREAPKHAQSSSAISQYEKQHILRFTIDCMQGNHALCQLGKGLTSRVMIRCLAVGSLFTILKIQSVLK
jgi:hypothetical protein